MTFETDMVAALRRIRGSVLRFCRTVEHTDDVLQETAVRALEGRRHFDGRNIEAWLYTIAYRVHNSMWRKRRREVEDVDGDIAAAVAVPGAQEHAIELGEVRAIMERMSAVLLAVLLADVGGHSQEHTAATLGIPLGTVKSRLFRARRLLGVPPNQPRGRTCRSEKNANPNSPVSSPSSMAAATSAAG